MSFEPAEAAIRTGGKVSQASARDGARFAAADPEHRDRRSEREPAAIQSAPSRLSNPVFTGVRRAAGTYAA